jgi:hypothetical protein
MPTLINTIMGISGHYDVNTHTGGWAVYIRSNERVIELFGILPRISARECEAHAFIQGARALKTLLLTLTAVEVSIAAKRALVADGPIKGSSDRWNRVRAWWKGCFRVGVRVTRQVDDTYSLAARLAETAALTRVQKLTLSVLERAPRTRVHEKQQPADRKKRQPPWLHRNAYFPDGQLPEVHVKAQKRDAPLPESSSAVAFGPIQKLNDDALNALLADLNRSQPVV